MGTCKYFLPWMPSSSICIETAYAHSQKNKKHSILVTLRQGSQWKKTCNAKYSWKQQYPDLNTPH